MSAEPLPPAAQNAAAGPKPRVPLKIEEILAAATLGVVAVITLANVLVRYFTDFSFAFTEEISICLMVMMTFFGASVAVVRNHHMRITFLADKLPPAWRRRAELFALVATAAMFLILAVFGASFAYDDYRFEVSSPALGLPQWIYTAWLPLLSAVVAARAVGRMVRVARGSES